MFDPKQHYENSSLREVIVEHLFVGAALQCLWNAGITDAEILRSEFDGFGYDLVVTWGELVRHVQLKSGVELKKVGISILLAEKPSGCVIFIKLSDSLELGPFHWFGDRAGAPLPQIDHFPSTKRTTPNSEGSKPSRRRHYDVPANRFQRVETLQKLVELLLGHPLEQRT